VYLKDITGFRSITKTAPFLQFIQKVFGYQKFPKQFSYFVTQKFVNKYVGSQFKCFDTLIVETFVFFQIGRSYHLHVAMV